MSMACTICTHDKRLEIDQAIVQGKSFQSIAKSYGVDAQCVSRHAKNHLSRQLLKHDEIRDRINSGRILDEVEDLLTRTKRILRDSEADNQRGMALGAIREIRSTLEFLSKLAITLQAIQQQEGNVENDQEEYIRKENISRLELVELNLLGDLQAKINGEIPWRRLLPDKFYESEDDFINISVAVPKDADIEPERIVIRAPDEGGSISVKTDSIVDNFVDVEGQESEPEQVEPKPEPEQEPTMTRRTPKFAKITYGPSLPLAQRRRLAKRYVKEHGALPRESWLRETLD